jgi:hypothetical protein
MAERQRICVECERQFSYEIKRGADRKYCGEVCVKASRRKQRPSKLCDIEGKCIRDKDGEGS